MAKTKREFNFLKKYPGFISLIAILFLLVLMLLIELVSMGIIRIGSDSLYAVTLKQHPLLGMDDYSNNLEKDHRGKVLLRDPNEFHPLYGWRYNKPSVFWGLKTDKFGFILNDTTQTSAIESGAEIRVFIVGGSTVAGAGASSNKQTIAAHLEYLLEQKYNFNANVVNAGVGGYYSVQEKTLIMDEIIPFLNPDMIIVLDGWNDMMRAAYIKRKLQYNGDIYVTQDNYLTDPNIEKYMVNYEVLMSKKGAFYQYYHQSTIGKILNIRNYFTSTLAGVFINKFSHTDNENEINLSVKDRRRKIDIDSTFFNFKLYENNIRSVLGASTFHNIPISYVLQPSIVYKTFLQENEQKTLEEFNYLLYKGFWNKYCSCNKLTASRMAKVYFNRMGTFFSDKAEEQPKTDVPIYANLLNLSKLFQDDQNDAFYDYCHYTDYGNLVIAKALLSEVEKASIINCKSLTDESKK